MRKRAHERPLSLPECLNTLIIRFDRYLHSVCMQAIRLTPPKLVMNVAERMASQKVMRKRTVVRAFGLARASHTKIDVLSCCLYCTGLAYVSVGRLHGLGTFTCAGGQKHRLERTHAQKGSLATPEPASVLEHADHAV